MRHTVGNGHLRQLFAIKESIVAYIGQSFRKGYFGKRGMGKCRIIYFLQIPFVCEYDAFQSETLIKALFPIVSTPLPKVTDSKALATEKASGPMATTESGITIF